MNIIIKTKNLELTGYLETLINKKMEGLKKFITILKDSNSEVFIEIEKESNHHKKGDIFRAEGMIQLPGKNLVAQAHEKSIEKAIVEVRKELENEIKKYKLKTVELPRREAKKSRKQMF